VPKQDPEIVFPRAALAALAENGRVGELAPLHFSFMGGVRDHPRIEKELAPALAEELTKARVDLALLVPY
jgi:D-proline reductase (dithiol) PrdB